MGSLVKELRYTPSPLAPLALLTSSHSIVKVAFKLATFHSAVSSVYQSSGKVIRRCNRLLPCKSFPFRSSPFLRRQFRRFRVNLRTRGPRRKARFQLNFLFRVTFISWTLYETFSFDNHPFDVTLTFLYIFREYGSQLTQTDEFF